MITLAGGKSRNHFGFLRDLTLIGRDLHRARVNQARATAGWKL